MVNYRNAVHVFLFVIMFLTACKTDEILVVPKVINEKVLSIRDQKVVLQYELSAFGYESTGVTYYRKDKPDQVENIQSIKKSAVFHVELDQLDPETEYVLSIYYNMDGKVVSDKILEVKTTAAFPETIDFQELNADVNYDETGLYHVRIVGANLNKLNLKDLQIWCSGEELYVNTPKHISSDKYEMELMGFNKYQDNSTTIRIVYKDKEVFFQRFDMTYKGQLPVINFTKTLLRPWFAVSLHDQLYYFHGMVISRSDTETGTLIPLLEYGHDNGLFARNAITMGDKIFFMCQANSHMLPNSMYEGKEIYSHSYDVKANKIVLYRYGIHNWSNPHDFFGASIFTHDGTIFQSYSLSDQVNGRPTIPNPTIKNYIAKYNPTKDRFEDFTNFDSKYLGMQFISIDNQLYGFGTVDNIDQGFKVGSTFAIFKVNPDNFAFEEIHRIGDKHNTFPYAPSSVHHYKDKILLSFGVNRHMLYDPKGNKITQLAQREDLDYSSFTGIYQLQNKLHLFINSTLYEISID